ncbi:MAG: TonB-dependent receptor plug domain-containing protein [Puniceicoccales bacterium]|nr:TonB-dependent receptor plug domain-containing protein [Puniceicoccales bacterium]
MTRLAPVLVTASVPFVQSADAGAFANAPTVVGRAQIEELNAPDIGSALRTVPGVSISRNGIVGSYGGAGGGGIFIRGLGVSRPGGELLTLFDGVPRFNPLFSHPLLDLLSTDAAESLTVHKGAAPHVFGNGFAAINIEPRSAPAAEGFGGEVFGGYGTHDTVAEAVTVHGRQGPEDFTVGQSFRRSAGHRVNGGGELEDYFARLGYSLNEHWSLSLSADHTNNYAEDPGDTRQRPFHQGNYHSRDTMGVFTLANNYATAKGYIKGYYQNGRAAWFDQGMSATNPAFSPTADDLTAMDWNSYGVHVREVFTPLENIEFLLGADIDAQSGKASFSKYNGAKSHFERTDFVLYSPYAAVSRLFGNVEGFYAQPSAGLRFYAHNVFDAEAAPHAGLKLGYKDTELRANYARGVSYPGQYTAVFHTVSLPFLTGAPATANAWRDLDAETLDHFEIALSHRIRPELTATVTGFYDDGHDRMIMVFPGAGVTPGFANVARYHNYGVEVAIAYSPIRDLSLFAGATWLRSKSDPYPLPFAPKWSASAGFTWRFLENFRFSVDATWRDSMLNMDGTRMPSAAATAPAALQAAHVSPFFLLNARLAYEFALPAFGIKSGEVFIAGENLTDTNYYYRPGYPMPGIGGMVGLKARF